MLKLFLIRGLPGSGKSTLATRLLKEVELQGKRGIILEADQFFSSSNGHTEIYNFDRRFLGAAHDECYGRAMRYLRDGYLVFVANTFTTHRELERYINGYKRCGLDKENPDGVYVIKCVGEFRSKHGVPQKAIEKMKGRWEDYTGEVVYR